MITELSIKKRPLNFRDQGGNPRSIMITEYQVVDFAPVVTVIMRASRFPQVRQPRGERPQAVVTTWPGRIRAGTVGRCNPRRRKPRHVAGPGRQRRRLPNRCHAGRCDLALSGARCRAWSGLDSPTAASGSLDTCACRRLRRGSGPADADPGLGWTAVRRSGCGRVASNGRLAGRRTLNFRDHSFRARRPCDHGTPRVQADSGLWRELAEAARCAPVRP